MGPDEPKAWGPWWSKTKQEWCCLNKNIGCYHGEWQTGKEEEEKDTQTQLWHEHVPEVWQPSQNVRAQQAAQPHDARLIVACFSAGFSGLIITAVVLKQRN